MHENSGGTGIAAAASRRTKKREREDNFNPEYLMQSYLLYFAGSLPLNK